jgi:FtsP/CotA-like multicopper oxidase with cupredoxin domain
VLDGGVIFAPIGLRRILQRTGTSRWTIAATLLAAAASVTVLHQTVPHQGIHDLLSGAEAAAGTGHHGGGGGGAGGGSGEHRGAAAFEGRSRCPKHAAPFIHDEFPEPNFRRSRNGLLQVRLRAARVPTEINGKRYVTPSYNASFPGPTLVFCQRDLVRINLRNALRESDFKGEHAGETNLHTHGFHVSPRRPQDNIFVTIPPSRNFQYQYKIPGDHPPGAYWYHPHVHGQTNIQAFGGMAGAMVVRGGLDVQRGYRNIGTRVIVIQQTTLDDANGTTVQPGPQGPFTPMGAQFFINGELNPEIPIQPGELQRWRIYNATAGSFVDLQLEDQPFQLLATDGNNLQTRQREDSLLISPSSRREVLVRGGPEGTAELVALPFAQFGGAPSAQQTLATLNSQGPEVDDPMPPRRLNDQQPDLRKKPVNSHHEIAYTQSPPHFFINGEQFEGPQDVAEVLKLNKVSEWTIRNETNFWHTFHIHINDFQVIEHNGKPVPGQRKDDNVSIPPNESITMRYLPRKYTGKFVFHCHVLGHEDNGMMGVVKVVK